jgi:hypothetical protein
MPAMLAPRFSGKLDDVLLLGYDLERAVSALDEPTTAARTNPVAAPCDLGDGAAGHSRKATKPLARNRMSMRPSSFAARG